MQFGLKPFSQDQLDVKHFLENLILSDEAKKFLIARELFRGIKCRHFTEAFFPIFVLAATVPGLARFFNYSGLKQKPFLIRLAAITFASFFVLSGYLLVIDAWRKRGEQVVDDAACQLGPAYARGGVEFYNKMLLRHIALRELMPDGKGKKLYNLKGENYPPLLRSKHIPFAKRRENCRDFIATSYQK
jgi:hypothetical protein